ncbi:MAG TPA: hypothetical protein PKM27_05970 [Saprospiraceae bacterium]|nr:hypothetical protein [Saprospiraceae bacterium]HNT19567.1 hypothetical protein [Saprospiraceae bacterium]
MVLVVDLDGTYLKNDFFAERFYKRLIENPFFVVYHLFTGGILQLKNLLLDKGRAEYPLDPLINSEVEKFILANRRNYERVVLVSASPDFFVKQVLSENEIFDAVHGSVEENLKGEKKLEFIRNRFGEDFHYIGNHGVDIPILRAAKKGFIVKENRIHEYP